MKDKFSFWLPIEKAEIKSDDATGKKEMFLQGIASTDDWDLDDQILENKGFDTSYLLDRGFINWHHMAKTMPSAIIGEPRVANVTKDGLFIKAQLYNTQMGRDAYKTACNIQKNSTTRRLGWSIEGKAIEKDGNRIKKAILTGIALTYAPKNSPTFAEVCKGFTDENIAERVFEESNTLEKEKFSLEVKDTIVNMKKGVLYINEDGTLNYFDKAMSAGSVRGFETGGNALKTESLEKKKKNLKINTFSTKLLQTIITKYPTMHLTKAFKLHDLLINKKLT